ncbi:alcohol dehydrogenase catalytic domain-containing protein [Nonomuraea sp. NPDC050786]|uniref:zinc-binding dehydrogenase n=1 Tax=Nonomuraea sp. NPDC050786 TaxID=3154840 RepID=UPI0033D77DD7
MRVESVPDPVLQQPTDAVVRIVRSCACGSDLHPYHSLPASEQGTPMGHEFLGVIEDLGSEVSGLKRGDLVVSPFAWSDNTCVFCREGLQTSCLNGGFWARDGVGGGLADVYGTGHLAAKQAHVDARTTVAVIGDRAVGLMAVLSARRLGAERIILSGRHEDRTKLGIDFGATDVVPERGSEGIERVRELTGGQGVHAVLEAVGYMNAYETAFGIVRPGGVISRAGVPQYEDVPIGFGGLFGPDITLTGGPAPVRSYIEELMSDVPARNSSSSGEPPLS